MPLNSQSGRMDAAAAEAEDVLRTTGHETYAKAAGLRNAVAAGLAPPAAFVRDVRAALEHELKKSGDAAPPEAGIDSGMTRATRVTLRGVLKRFEDAFGTGRKGSGGS
jgi:hypothetical protein